MALKSKSRRLTADEQAVRHAVFLRDGGCVLARRNTLHSCHGPLTYHHLLKASQGGGYTEANGVALCAAGNSWVEDWPLLARTLGLVRFSWESDEQWMDYLEGVAL